MSGVTVGPREVMPIMAPASTASVLAELPDRSGAKRQRACAAAALPEHAGFARNFIAPFKPPTHKVDETARRSVLCMPKLMTAQRTPVQP